MKTTWNIMNYEQKAAEIKHIKFFIYAKYSPILAVTKYDRRTYFISWDKQ